MSAEFWSEAARMLSSWLLVATGAVPVGLLAWAVRPPGEPLLPRWKPWRVPWDGLGVLLAFAIGMYVLPLLVFSVLEGAGFFQAIYGPDFPAARIRDADSEELKAAKRIANTLRGLWASAVALPLQLAALWAALRGRYPQWKPALVGRGSRAGKVCLAVLAWLALAPIVLSLNAAVNELSAHLGTPPDAHPLTRLAGRAGLDRALFVMEACIGAPVREEVLIRGLLLAWCVRRMAVPGVGVRPVTAARPWFVMGAAGVLAARAEHSAALVFAAVLALGLAAVWRFTRRGARRTRAVYATAAFFALLHSSWPNPVPLFVLGLGLGWLAVRTNGLLVPVLVHGLFNAVSVVFLLRGA